MQDPKRPLSVEEVERLIADLRAGRLAVQDMPTAGEALAFYSRSARRLEAEIHRLTH